MGFFGRGFVCVGRISEGIWIIVVKGILFVFIVWVGLLIFGLKFKGFIM